MKYMKVINNITGKISNATYAHNRLGNLRMWVEGKFYSDNKFDKTFSLIDPTENYIKLNGQWQRRDMLNHSPSKHKDMKRRTSLKVGDKLYWIEGVYFGTVIKVIIRDCHVLREDGTIERVNAKMWEKQVRNN